MAGASAKKVCRTLDYKRKMRDDLDGLILLWCAKQKDILIPIGKEDAYESEIAKDRPKKS